MTSETTEFGITDEDRERLRDLAENNPPRGRRGSTVEKVELKCETCGEPFHVPPSHSDRRYCSVSCAHEAGAGGRPRKTEPVEVES